MNGHIMEGVSFQKDLGVIIDQDLKFHQQTAASVKKANQILGLIKKTISIKNEETLPLLYMSSVRPHLEYANVVWGPFYKTDQQMIEKVQKRATKLIVTITNQTYEERLRHLNMTSLLHRGRRGDMIEMFKIMKGFVNTNKENYFEPAREVRTRGHRYKVQKHHANTFLKQNVFSNRVTTEWNNLPNHVVDATSVNSFKRCLDKHWFNRKFETPFT